MGQDVCDLDPLKVLRRSVDDMGGQTRTGQEDMVAEVYRALDEEDHLLVQAGTGTGKSLGYLVPAMVWAAGGHRVTVSTATLALQRQIIEHDAPQVARTIRQMDGTHIEVAVLKGWNNYLCLRTVDGSDEELFPRAAVDEKTTPTGEEVMRARAWAHTTDTGDRDDLVPGISDRAWAQVSVNRRECVGALCPLRSECFAFRAREAAHDADVIVTNHSLLGIEAAGTPVLPDTGAYIIDEAHELVDRVTSQLTQRISMTDFRVVSRLLTHEGIDDDGLVGIAESIFAGLADGRIVELSDERAAALTAVSDTLFELIQTVADISDGDDEARVRRHVMTARLTELHDICSQILSPLRSTGELVVWVQEEGSRILTAPIDVSHIIGEGLLRDTPTILTSATLHIGGDFTAMAHRLGMTHMPWRGIDVGTPFDPARQGILYVAADLPAPHRDGYGTDQLERMVELIRASHGGALGLFTSHRAAQRAAEYVRGYVDVPVAVQGEDQLPTLVAMFAKDPHACLFGTLSLWQGIDVPGFTNRLVIIDRIPFPRPTDPQIEARSDLVARRGGSAFMEVSANQAALLLAQGAGRLLRVNTDRGVVAVLDPRLVRQRYGSYLRASMLPMWFTTDTEQALAALQRLYAAHAADEPLQSA